ncbi:MAG: hypothetical protein CVU56_23815 [Deltaproteobacteria bacterium HGW-Deltaproteobacteria-14]|nr:MAG: hypothetical protein CVU56_23815 [Deltaproteobacteria bacterium HGW-Deltaproteobacteria-14]
MTGAGDTGAGGAGAAAWAVSGRVTASAARRRSSICGKIHSSSRCVGPRAVTSVTRDVLLEMRPV